MNVFTVMLCGIAALYAFLYMRLIVRLLVQVPTIYRLWAIRRKVLCFFKRNPHQHFTISTVAIANSLEKMEAASALFTLLSREKLTLQYDEAGLIKILRFAGFEAFSSQEAQEKERIFQETFEDSMADLMSFKLA